jgi:hypothetical protein
MLNKEEVPGKKQEGRSKKEIFSSSITPPLSPSDTPLQKTISPLP